MKCKYLLFLIILAILIPTTTVFSQKDKTLLILGSTFSYFNYDPTEIKTFTENVNQQFFLGGFTVGILSGNTLLDFTYQEKISINNDIYQLPNDFKMIHKISMYTLGVGYLWSFLRNIFYVGPYIALSLDTSFIQLFKNLDTVYSLENWTVKNLLSRTLSIGVGMKFFIIRYLKFSIAYQYGFPNTVNYEGIPVNGTRTFQPSGLIISLTLGI